VNKPGTPEVVEMGGLGIAAGFGSGILLAIALESFFGQVIAVDLVALFAGLSTIAIVVIIGILDDILELSQGVKAFLPVFASLPVLSINVGKTVMQIPLIGRVDFGIIYPLILVPLGITGAANGANMLAGFNGLEVGMGIVAASALAFIAFTLKETTSLVLLLALLGALLATFYYNRYPARILIGDVGTLSIGSVIATSVILGNFESAGVIIIVPYFIDFLIKAVNHFPSKGWWGSYKDGKLYCPNSKPVSLCQWIMKLSGGISEQNLVLTLIVIEAVFGLVAILLFVM